jgi:hypothetical protein
MFEKYNIKHKAELYQIGIIVEGEKIIRSSKNLDSLLLLSKDITFFFFLSASLHTFVQNQVIRVVQPL